MYECFACIYVRMYIMCEHGTHGSIRGCQIPWELELRTFVSLHLCGFWELNLNPLQEWQMLLATKPSPQFLVF